jgi:hypothetical protein
LKKVNKKKINSIKRKGNNKKLKIRNAKELNKSYHSKKLNLMMVLEVYGKVMLRKLETTMNLMSHLQDRQEDQKK